MTTFYEIIKIAPTDDIQRLSVFSDDARRTLVVTAGNSVSVSLHLTLEQAAELADSLIDCIDWHQGTEGRAIAAREQEQRDALAGGERVEQHSDERGEFDAQTVRVPSFLSGVA